MKERVFDSIDLYAPRFREISRLIGENPELGHEEFFASSTLIAELAAHGFTIETEVLGLKTAFIASYASEKPGPVIAFLAEYDALPEIGHACGHHLICSMSSAAGVGLKSVIDELGGTIRIYGTPAEETRGAKVDMANAGLFDDCDIALMAHPYHGYETSGKSLAMDALQFEFFGKTAHAAACPHDGVNALDAVLQVFNSVNALRQQLKSDVRIHGVITEGGKAANIIPDYTVAQFYVRSSSRAYTTEVTEKVLRCAEGAALQTGCTVKVSNYEYSYDELKTNEELSSVFTQNLVGLGIERGVIRSSKDHGSLDLGNVSLRCPAIHPYVKVVDKELSLHTKEFRDLAMLERAFDGMILGAKALAGTAFDVLTQPGILESIKREFVSGDHSSVVVSVDSPLFQ